MEEDHKKKLAHEIALFRHSVLGDLVHLAPGHRGLYDLLHFKADKDYQIPNSLRRRVAVETIRHWLKLYRKGGFDALIPKTRRDAETSRKIPQEVQDLLVALKDEHRDWTVKAVIKEALDSGKIPLDLPLPPSTVHRLFTRHGLMQKLPAAPTTKDHRKFAFQKAGDLWMSDVMHGPAVICEGRRKRKTFLIAFLDDATRVIPYAAFQASESTAAFLPCLKQAILRRGIPKRLFVDNGSAYRSQHLALVCAKLGVTLIHARAYHPQAKGKQERFFRTVRMQLLPHLRPEDLSNLDALNRRLWAWVEGEYHRAPHRGLDGDTPIDRWAQVADEVRYGAGLDLDDLFLFEAQRKVHKDRVVSLNGIGYEVDAALVDETVTLRYDPSSPGRPIKVQHKGQFIQTAKVVDAYANCFVRRDRPSAELESMPAAEAPPPKATPEPPRRGLDLARLAQDDDQEDR
jgi:transposase InsO family protein